MVNLIARSPCVDLLPVTVGTLSLHEEAPCGIIQIMPFQGKEALVSTVLEKTAGLSFPSPNSSSVNDGVRIMWFGRGTALLMGCKTPSELVAHAHLTDQTDAWAVVTLSGENAADVLARLTPLDLRQAAMPEGASQRSLIGHMTASISRTGPDQFRIMVFRSMAMTLVQELKEAMEAVVARG